MLKCLQCLLYDTYFRVTWTIVLFFFDGRSGFKWTSSFSETFSNLFLSTLPQKILLIIILLS